MGTVTNTSDEDLEVSLLDGRIVKAGETVEDVHDDLLHAHDESCGAELPGTSTREHCDKHGFVWPAATWLVNGEPQAGQGAPPAKPKRARPRKPRPRKAASIPVAKPEPTDAAVVVDETQE